MNFHIERGLKFNSALENKTLYRWSIGEADDGGQQVGQDQIPWPWTLSFTATEIVLSDRIDIEIEGLIASQLPRMAKVEQHRVIRAKLRPGNARSDDDWSRQTTFKMFGSDRVISDFQLDILPLTDPEESENCQAWGSVSYDYETDFRHKTTSDIVIFYLMVRPETFDRYVARIAHGTADEVILSVGGVEGFYSEWSPSISTRDVKVLTPGDEHKVTMPDGIEYEVPRLGPVGEADFSINAKRVQARKAMDEDEGDMALRSVQEAAAPMPALADPRILKLLSSLKTAAWIIVAAAVITMIATLARRLA